tara:strand:- start:2075 stop:2353 length:279 start_codon:yes stop_codon:yes gene_type:complete
MKGDGKILEALNVSQRHEFAWHGGEGVLLASSDAWAGRTVKLQQLIGNVYVDIQGAILSGNGGLQFTTTAPKLGIVLSGSSAHSVFVSAQGI